MANWIPHVANGVGYLTSVLLRALEQGPLEERMAKIEAALAQNVNSIVEPSQSRVDLRRRLPVRF